MAEAGCVLAIREGCTEWVFNELPALVAELPAGVGVRRATELLRERCSGLSFASRDIRDAISRARQPGHGPACFETAFVIRQTVSSRGLSAFAERDIKRGERILAEAPLIEVAIPRGGSINLTSLVNGLSESDRASYFSLSQNAMYGEAKSAVGIWRTNAYPQDSPLRMAADLHHGVEPPEKKVACYAAACRFNHSCTPNAHIAWNGGLRKQTIHVLRDIATGEELSVSYLAELATPSADRRRKLRECFGFECECAACARVDDARWASDERRARIGQLAAMVSGTNLAHRDQTEMSDITISRIEPDHLRPRAICLPRPSSSSAVSRVYRRVRPIGCGPVRRVLQLSPLARTSHFRSRLHSTETPAPRLGMHPPRRAHAQTSSASLRSASPCSPLKDSTAQCGTRSTPRAPTAATRWAIRWRPAHGPAAQRRTRASRSAVTLSSSTSTARASRDAVRPGANE